VPPIPISMTDSGADCKAIEDADCGKFALGGQRASALQDPQVRHKPRQAPRSAAKPREAPRSAAMRVFCLSALSGRAGLWYKAGSPQRAWAPGKGVPCDEELPARPALRLALSLSADPLALLRADGGRVLECHLHGDRPHPQDPA